MRRALQRRRALLAAAAALTLAALGATTASAASPDPLDTGSGSPILVLGAPGDPYARYYAEILRAEGLNEFHVRTLADVNASSLSSYGVVILAQTGLSDAQASMLSTWVQAGGDLIAMAPDARLDGLLGVTRDGGVYSDADSVDVDGFSNDADRLYFQVDPSANAAKGITSTTMQFHGTAAALNLNGASRVATLFSSATTATSHPAVTLARSGAGQAAAFAFDVARSVIATRQGNIGWAGMERDNQNGPIRSNNLFFGGKGGLPPYRVLPDWLDLAKIQIPQADELQRLLANLVADMRSDAMPLPRFWYLPHGLRAAVVMTGDDHGSDIGSETNFDRLDAMSAPGCSVADWECVRATTYAEPDAASLTDAQVADYEQDGFEVALHLDAGCGDFSSRAAVEQPLVTQLQAFAALWPSAPRPSTNRTHCVPWSDWSTMSEVEAANGIRLDTNYYWWPPRVIAPDNSDTYSWAADHPGVFTGSAIPMRFTDRNGNVIDTYQATTQLTDELVSQYIGTDDDRAVDALVRQHLATLLGNALGANAYVGAFTLNMHTDYVGADGLGHPGIIAAVQEAQSRGVPVISARQLLTWTDGRNASSFRDLSFVNGQLRFRLAPGAGARGLQAMLPVNGGGGTLQSLSSGGVPVATEVMTFKGVQYATFRAGAGDYLATYSGDGGTSGGGSGGSGSSGETPGVTAADARAKRLAIASRIVRAARNGDVRVRVGCPTAKPCVVRLVLRRRSTVIARRTVKIIGRRTTAITLRLTPSARVTLRRKLGLSARLSVSAPGTQSASRLLVLRQPR